MSGPWRRTCTYHAQVAGLVLHTLEPDEEIDVREHLPGCPSCQAELRESERVLAELGGAVEQVDPPASLRAAILAEAATTPQTLDGGRPLVSADEPTAPREPRRSPRGPRSAPPGTPRPAGRRARRLLAAALAVVAVVAIGGLAVRTAQLTAERDAETAQAQELADIVFGLDRPGVLHANLATPDGQVLAALVVHDGRRTLVRSEALEPNAADRDTYVVWGMHEGAPPRPIASFDVRVAEAAVHSVGPDVPADGFSAYALSIEPGRVAPASPTTVLASGALQT